MTPVALSAGTVMAVFLVAVIVLGYVVIWAIWPFVFRGAGDHVPGDTSSGSGAGNDVRADGSDVPRVARHSASPGEDDRRA